MFRPRGMVAHQIVYQLATLPSLIAVTAVMALACGEGSGPSAPQLDEPVVNSVTVSPPQAQMEALGSTQEFDAEARDSDGNVIEGLSFSWSSSDTSIAIVDSTGLATGIDTGSVQITASADGENGSGSLSIRQEVNSLIISPNEDSLYALTDTLRFSAEAEDKNGNVISDADVNWTSSDSSIAAINSSGLVEAVGNGIASIMATAGNSSDSARIVVEQRATQLVFSSPPDSGVAGTVIFPTISVKVADALGIRVATASDLITITLEDARSDAQLSGDTIRRADQGSAQFSNLSIDLPGDDYRLQATADTLQLATTLAFEVLLRFEDIDAGRFHTCGVSRGNRVFCWGRGTNGELGIGTTANHSVPVRAATSEEFSLVGAGRYHTCSIGISSSATYCWGRNGQGQLGDGTTTTRLSPVQVMTSEKFADVSAGVLSHTCARAADDNGYCWGNNEAGQLGNGTTTDQTSPIQVSNISSLAAIQAGQRFSCGVTVNNEGFCWGSNGVGQLGDGTTESSQTPVQVVGDHMWGDIRPGRFHACGLETGGNALCWGRNNFGQLGDGTQTDRSSPVAVSGQHIFVSITAGVSHSCGLTDDDGAYCWGNNFAGALGDGSTQDSSVPQKVVNSEQLVVLTAGAQHTCGLTESGVAYCWGGNEYGQLGDGTTTGRTAPVEVIDNQTP